MNFGENPNCSKAEVMLIYMMKGGFHMPQQPVYYYDARINNRKVLYKTHRPDLEYGDTIIHKYASGATSKIVITYGYGTALPAHLLSRARSSSYWPLIVSAF